MQLFRAFLLAALIIAYWGPHCPVLADSNIKVGVNYQIASGATYTLEDSTSGTPKGNNADTMVGNEIFFEWIVLGRVGLEIANSLTPLERNYELTSGGTTLSQVNEKASLLTYGANLYFNRNTTRGMQYYLGVGGGSLTVDHEFTNGTLGDKTSSLTLPVSWYKLGFDWIIPGGGVRLQYSSLTASATDLDQITSFKQTLVYNLAIIGVGVFLFF